MYKRDGWRQAVQVGADCLLQQQLKQRASVGAGKRGCCVVCSHTRGGHDTNLLAHLVCALSPVPCGVQSAQHRVGHASSREQLDKLRESHQDALLQGERDAAALQGLAEVRAASCLPACLTRQALRLTPG